MQEIVSLITKAKAVKFIHNAGYRHESAEMDLTYRQNIIVSRTTGRNLHLEMMLDMGHHTIIEIKIDTPNIDDGEALMQMLSIKDQF